MSYERGTPVGLLVRVGPVVDFGGAREGAHDQGRVHSDAHVLLRVWSLIRVTRKVSDKTRILFQCNTETGLSVAQDSSLCC